MPATPRRLPTDVQVLPPVFPAHRMDTPEHLRLRSTLRGGHAGSVLSGQLSEQEYLRHIVSELTKQGQSLYEILGSPHNANAEARLIQAMHNAKTGAQKPADVLNLFMLLNKLSDPATARAMGKNPLKILPLRSHTYSAPLVGQKAGQYSSMVFRPQPDADITQRMILNAKTGPMEIVKTSSVPFVDIDTPTTGRFTEVHPQAGITAGSKEEALAVLQRLSNAIGSTFRAYSSPGGIRAFDVSRQAIPSDFYRKILALGDKELLAKLDPHYVDNTLKMSQLVPIGSAVRRWDPKTGKYYAFPLDYVFDFSGFPVRTSPKFNRNPLTDYVAAHIGTVAPTGKQPQVDPAMLETVLRTHDARAIANRARSANAPMLADLSDLSSQSIAPNLKEFIKRNYKLLVTLGLLPAAATVTTSGQQSNA